MGLFSKKKEERADTEVSLDSLLLAALLGTTTISRNQRG